MKIGEKEYAQIVLVNENEEVIAVISDDEIIEKKGYRVILDLT